ncbi:hypothetical protein MCOR17_007716 [Pyricularia oryzae]|nr:hypothetical protein MCOR17_007716 [Pyricularia oryzae]
MFQLKALVCSLLAVLALPHLASGYANPGACSGQCWTHDPAVVRRDDGVYFRFSTGSKIGIWKAPALEGPWTYQGAAIPAGSRINLPGRDDLWAPDVAKVGSQYIMYYSVSTFGSQNSAVGYATSPSMEFNSWTDCGATGLQSRPGNTYNAIDANYIQARGGTGERVLNFGSFWGGIHQVALDGAGTQVGSGGAAPLGLQFQPAGTHASEGPFMFERQGWYYLFWSEGVCCGFDKNLPAPGAEYKIRVCRSQNFRGPFVDRNGVDCRNGGGTTVLESHGFVYGPGGQGVMTDPKKGTILYYHYADRRGAIGDGDKKFGWNVVNWGGGWPSV